MTMPLRDPHVRLVLLNHLALRLADAPAEEVGAAGLTSEQLARLRRLAAVELDRLAAMSSLTIGVSLDGHALEAGLRTLVLFSEARALENYFIRAGASTSLMFRLFKVHRKGTLKLRRQLGARRPAGRAALPDHATRERIYLEWRAGRDLSPRARYYQLHQRFPDLPIAVLEAVIRAFEAMA
jgi:hypothetical protein